MMCQWVFIKWSSPDHYDEQYEFKSAYAVSGSIPDRGQGDNVYSKIRHKSTTQLFLWRFGQY